MTENLNEVVKNHYKESDSWRVKDSRAQRAKVSAIVRAALHIIERGKGQPRKHADKLIKLIDISLGSGVGIERGYMAVVKTIRDILANAKGAELDKDDLMRLHKEVSKLTKK